MTCPRCGSSSCQFIDAAKEKSWDDYEDRLTPEYFFLGPLWFFIKRKIDRKKSGNMKKSGAKHQNYWVCNDCGKEWMV